MPQGVYVGKRVVSTMSPTLYKLLKRVAKHERRPMSQMVVTLIIEAMLARGIEIPEEPDDDDQEE